MWNLVRCVSETQTRSSDPARGLQRFRILAEPFPYLPDQRHNLRLELSLQFQHFFDPVLDASLLLRDRPAFARGQMFNPLLHVDETGVLSSDPAIDLQRFRIPT